MCQFILSNSTNVFRLCICIYSILDETHLMCHFMFQIFIFFFLSELNLTLFRRLSTVCLCFPSWFSMFIIHWIILTTLPMSPITNCVSELNLSLFLRRLHSLPHRERHTPRKATAEPLLQTLRAAHIHSYEYTNIRIRIYEYEYLQRTKQPLC